MQTFVVLYKNVLQHHTIVHREIVPSIRYYKILEDIIAKMLSCSKAPRLSASPAGAVACPPDAAALPRLPASGEILSTVLY